MDYHRIPYFPYFIYSVILYVKSQNIPCSNHFFRVKSYREPILKGIIDKKEETSR